jgi:hypothetical protein
LIFFILSFDNFELIVFLSSTPIIPEIVNKHPQSIQDFEEPSISKIVTEAADLPTINY